MWFFVGILALFCSNSILTQALQHFSQLFRHGESQVYGVSQDD